MPRSSSSVPREFPEPLRRQGGIARRVLNIAMPEIGLDRTGVVAIVGELVAAGMTEHAGVRLDAQIGHVGCPLDQAGKPGADSGPAFRDKHEWGMCTFPLMTSELAPF
jgi:hypothetical protein